MFDPAGAASWASTPACPAAATAPSPAVGGQAQAVGVRRDPHPADDPLPRSLARSKTSSPRSSRSCGPPAVAVERVLFQANVRTAISVGQASGLALVAAARRGIPVAQYSPNEVKLAVTGDGRADKREVQRWSRGCCSCPRYRSRPTRPTRSRLARAAIVLARRGSARSTSRAQ